MSIFLLVRTIGFQDYSYDIEFIGINLSRLRSDKALLKILLIKNVS